MRRSNRGKVLLVGACMLAGAAGWAQQSQKPVKPATVSTDLAVTIAGERSQALPGTASFWFKGGGADAAVTFKNGLGIAASLTGDHASNITPGVDANKFTGTDALSFWMIERSSFSGVSPGRASVWRYSRQGLCTL